MDDYPLFCPVSGVRLIHSASSLAVADNNKAHYELCYIAGRAPESGDDYSNERMSFGRAFHEVMEEVVKCRQLDGSWEEAEQLAQYLVPGKLQAGLMAAVEEWFETWRGAYPEPLEDVPPEAPFLYPLPRKAPCGLPYVLFGIMDWPATLGPVGCIVDHKTTSKQPHPGYWVDHRNSWQARIYALAAKELTGSSNVLLHVTRRPGKTVPAACWRQMFTYSRDDLEDLETDILMLLVELELAQQESHYRRSYWSYDNSGSDFWQDTLDTPSKYRQDDLAEVELVSPIARWKEGRG